MPGASRRPRSREGHSATGPAGGRPIQFVDVIRRPPTSACICSRRISPARVGLYHYEADPATSTFPLSLISPASEHTISSTLGELRPGIARVKIHPDDAHAARDRRRRRRARLQRSRRSALRGRRSRRKSAPARVSLPKGLWAQEHLQRLDRQRARARHARPTSAAARASTTRECKSSCSRGIRLRLLISKCVSVGYSMR